MKDPKDSPAIKTCGRPKRTKRAKRTLDPQIQLLSAEAFLLCEQCTLASITVLEKVEELREAELSPLGAHMSMITADLRSLKLRVYGCIFASLDIILNVGVQKGVTVS